MSMKTIATKPHEESEYLNLTVTEQSDRQNEEIEFSLDIIEKAKTGLRQMRNAKLQDSDWTQMPDANLTTEVRDAWVAYRQALRDIPNTYTSIEDVIWPDINSFL